MRADSSLRELRSSLINEDADMMKVISPRPRPPGKATSTAACQNTFRASRDHVGTAAHVCRPERCSAAPHHKLSRPLRRVQTALQGAFAAFVIANADGLVHAGQKNFAVSDLAGAGRSQDGLYRLLDLRLGQ